MADACMEAARHVNRHGSPILQQAMRVVLFILGRELAERAAQRTRAGGRTGSGEAPPRSTGKRDG